MRVLDLFAGTGSSTQAFEDRGHEVVFAELSPPLCADLLCRTQDVICADVLSLTVDYLAKYGPFDFIWASPPCTTFSVASIGAHWTGGKRAYIPKTEAAVLGQELVAHTLRLIAGLAPRWWVMENPRGVLRKLDVVRGLPRVSVTYCAYGDDRMKPTDLWGVFPEGWLPRPMCKNGEPCHEAAPRGAKTGTQGRDGAKDRSMIPYELGLSLCLAAEGEPEDACGQLPLASGL